MRSTVSKAGVLQSSLSRPIPAHPRGWYQSRKPPDFRPSPGRRRGPVPPLSPAIAAAIHGDIQGGEGGGRVRGQGVFDSGGGAESARHGFM